MLNLDATKWEMNQLLIIIMHQVIDLMYMWFQNNMEAYEEIRKIREVLDK